MVDKIEELKKISFDKNGMLIPMKLQRKKLHRERNQRRCRTYRQKHPEKYRKYAKKWRQENPQRSRESVRKASRKRRNRGIDEIFQNYLEYLNGNAPSDALNSAKSEQSIDGGEIEAK